MLVSGGLCGRIETNRTLYVWKRQNVQRSIATFVFYACGADERRSISVSCILHPKEIEFHLMKWNYLHRVFKYFVQVPFNTLMKQFQIFLWTVRNSVFFVVTRRISSCSALNKNRLINNWKLRDERFVASSQSAILKLDILLSFCLVCPLYVHSHLS